MVLELTEPRASSRSSPDGIHFKTLTAVYNNMKLDAKTAQRMDKEEPPSGSARKLNVERAELPERRGNWFSRWATPLVAAFALNCGSSMVDEQDADSDAVQQDVEAEIENDVPDAEGREDVRDMPDVEAAEDAPTEAEDVGPDEADVPDTPETLEDAVPEAEDILPETEGSDSDVAEGTDAPDVAEEDAGHEFVDSPDCTENIRTEEFPTVLPDPVCGGTQTVSDIDTVIEWVGVDCESTGTTTTRTAKRLTLAPDLDVAGLGCARCRTTSTLTGDEVLVTVAETSLETANGIACADMTVGDNLDGGATEDKLRLTDVRADQATGTLFDSTWRLIRNVRIYPTGAPTAIDSSRGLIAAEFDISAATARICIIELPTILRNNGDIETWASYGDFTFNTNVSGTSMQGWEWAR